MRTIKPIVYDSLTPQQRLIATIEALARGDDSEHEKLKQTCPKQYYEMQDYRYSGTLYGLVNMAVAIEHELTSNTLSLMLSLQTQSDLADDFIQNISDIHTAWNETLDSMGIDVNSMEKMTAPLRHPLVNFVLEQDIEADEEHVLKHREWLESYLNKGAVLVN